jgi:hypothetical protein
MLHMRPKRMWPLAMAAAECLAATLGVPGCCTCCMCEVLARLIRRSTQRGTKWFPLPGGPLIHQLIINVTLNSIAASFGQQERKTRK